MARVCECGRYLGSRTTCRCGRTAPNTPSGMTAPPEATPLYPPPPTNGGFGPVGPQGAAPATGAGWGTLRGTVADGQPSHLGRSGGVMPAQLILFTVLGVVIFAKGPQLISVLTQGMLSLFLMFLGPILVVVLFLALASRVPGASGCLGALMHLAWIPSRLGSRSSNAVDGWGLLLDTSSGPVEVQLAANAPFQGGERVVVHGPVVGRVKHAWLLQCVGPRPFTRVGRGVIGLLLNTFVFVPLLVVFTLSL